MRGLIDESGPGRRAAWLTAAAEWLLITLAFAAAGAWPTPDVNEAVYLTKARHAADPDWGRGDFFLETPDAHGIFYRVMGPLAARLPLERAAWIGRVVGWGALAAGFCWAAMPLLAPAWARILAALLFSLALRHTTAAGEWVIGGCEAKVFAWAAVLGGLGEVARGRFPAAVLWCGIGAAFHPIVGGWSLVATLATWLVGLVARVCPEERSPRRSGTGSWVGVVLIVAGLAAAAAGVVPALGLSAGVDPAARVEAMRIYVVDRLAHHLLPRTFADGMFARHVLAVATWWLLTSLLPASAPRRRIATFTAASLAISLAGLLVAAIEPWAPTTAYGLLRYYWFRLADVAVPFALATTLAATLADDAICGRLAACRPGVVRWAAVGLLGLDLAVQSLHWPLPARSEVVPRADAKVVAKPWAEICDWVRAHTPADACFLTPRGAASFTWRTGRREVVSWKNSPQDAASLVAWRRRVLDCFSRSGSLVELERSTVSLGPDRLREVAERYGADHAIVPLDAPRIESMPGERLHDNGTYAVYRLRP